MEANDEIKPLFWFKKCTMYFRKRTKNYAIITNITNFIPPLLEQSVFRKFHHYILEFSCFTQFIHP